MDKHELGQQLKIKQNELVTRISAIENDFKNGRSQDFAEQATEMENDQVLTEIKQQAQVELNQVNSALNRLENNQYGVCEQCGNHIQHERLAALPYVQTCINCAQ